MRTGRGRQAACTTSHLAPPAPQGPALGAAGHGPLPGGGAGARGGAAGEQGGGAQGLRGGERRRALWGLAGAGAAAHHAGRPVQAGGQQVLPAVANHVGSQQRQVAVHEHEEGGAHQVVRAAGRAGERASRPAGSGWLRARSLNPRAAPAETGQAAAQAPVRAIRAFGGGRAPGGAGNTPPAAAGGVGSGPGRSGGSQGLWMGSPRQHAVALLAHRGPWPHGSLQQRPVARRPIPEATGELVSRRLWGAATGAAVDASRGVKGASLRSVVAGVHASVGPATANYKWACQRRHRAKRNRWEGSSREHGRVWRIQACSVARDWRRHKSTSSFRPSCL